MTQKIKHALVVMAELYDKKISAATVAMMADDLADLSEMDVLSALAKYRKDPTIRGFPTVGQIRAIVQPAVSDDGKARETASLIAMCMGKFGYTRPEEARAHMGEVAWSVVCLEGGWQFICENTLSENLAVVKSQWRELARATIQRQAAGLPLLNGPEQPKHDSKTELQHAPAHIAGLLPTKKEST